MVSVRSCLILSCLLVVLMTCNVSDYIQYNQRHLKSASVMPASSLQCAPYVLAQKAPVTDKGLYFDGTGFLSVFWTH